MLYHSISCVFRWYVARHVRRLGSEWREKRENRSIYANVPSLVNEYINGDVVSWILSSLTGILR